MKKMIAILPLAVLLSSCDKPTINGLMPIRGTIVTIAVNGTAKMTPDIAEVTGGIEGKGVTAKEALDKQATKMSAIIASLRALGIAANDITTQQVNLNPNYSWTQKGGQRIVGYQVNNIIKVKIRDTNKVSQVLDAMVGDGSNRIDGVEFKTENKDAPAQLARADAMTKAAARADAYATAAGLRVHKIISIQESGTSLSNPGAPTEYLWQQLPPPPPMFERKTTMAYDSSAATAAPSIPGGAIESEVHLQISYELRK
ncbi:MAG: hypothetical protein FD163_223 [Hyphomonadaceae bacterium]|nr:MAG: hypothetical protein FD128_169 [Hyphomonadaceae bacterium]KAF0186948.1 MAG: hypothetical protein FD163_223 [Hyphomonadaceae bacterium]